MVVVSQIVIDTYENAFVVILILLFVIYFRLQVKCKLYVYYYVERGIMVCRMLQSRTYGSVKTVNNLFLCPIDLYLFCVYFCVVCSDRILGALEGVVRW